ncbi:MAG: flagellar protein FlbB [Rhodospirillales bacterium]|nr:flagellar protein FlbB [Rhodospirillales bacterium]
MTFLDRVRILPLLILVASLSFAVRLGDFISGARSLAGQAFAQEEVKVEPPAFPAPAAGGAKVPDETEVARPVDQKEPVSGDGKIRLVDDTPEKKEEAGKKDAEKPGEKVPASAKRNWKDAADTDIEYADVKMELFQDLSSRRKSIETRERELATREAILKAGEQELDQKFRELETLRKEIEGLLQKQSSEEAARIGSLVKIYEAMKPKDAARIFDSLDMDVLMAVISRMSERKTSPIMAEMNPERARSITILLAQQKQLPVLSQE